ncbi:RNA polymerase sigma factor [Nocardioides sp.]|uniref:RNA polymerase sigma factor n=1 Tax=Nocardioides sp. TaxID=35761 RepID=UPI003527861C
MSEQHDDERAEVAARFELLARDLIEPLRRYLARRTDPETAADVLAETLLVCWRRFDDVPAGDGALPWAYGVTKGCLANAQRSARRQRRVAGKVAALDPPRETAPVPEGDPALHEALGRLSASDAELLRLWAWEQLKPAEIAVVLDLTPNAVSARLTRAKAALRKELARSRQDSSGTGHEPAEGRQ